MSVYYDTFSYPYPSAWTIPSAQNVIPLIPLQSLPEPLQLSPLILYTCNSMATAHFEPVLPRPHLTPALEIELRISHMLDRPFTTVLQPQPWARFSQVSWDLVLLFALPWAMVEPLEVEDLIHL